jgi:long-subunit acyl-CoA synthetase (AMP-forming)
MIVDKLKRVDPNRLLMWCFNKKILLLMSFLMYQLKGFEQIKGVILDPHPFDMDRELVTATMKKRRNIMLKYYQVI